MLSLLNRGVIPKDVDLTPAFERGNAPLTMTKATILDGSLKQPKHMTMAVRSDNSKYKLSHP